MELKQADFSDLPEILALQKAAFYRVGLQHRNFRIRPLRTTLEEIEKSFNKYVYLKLTENENILASGRAYMDGDICQIENIITSPYHQRRGLGSKIVLGLENLFSQCSSYQLFTGKETPGNREFYEKLGYVVTSEINPTETEPALIIMQKRAL